MNIELYVKQSDLVIGAVLIPGAKAPRLVTEDMIKQMKMGQLLLTLLLIKVVFLKQLIKLRQYDDPTYIKHGVVHYAVQICLVQYRVLRR